jgi:SLT domain-containing protein
MAWYEKHVADLPYASVEALKTAMHKEGTPDAWFGDLAWIMAQESEGKVGSKNPTSTAAGLFQLTRVNYSLMPHGKASIGNAVEEAQGGIRYIIQRYHTAANAKEFWMGHKVY